MRHWHIKFMICGFVAVVALVLVEGAARLYARFAVAQRTMTNDNTLGRCLIPGARKRHTVGNAYLIEINTHGFRDRDHELEKNPGARRILVLGDSFVFGYGGVEYGERFTDLLETVDDNTEVINFGVPSYSTDQEYLQFERLGLQWQPDTVLLCVYANAYIQCFQSYAMDIGRPKGYFTLEENRLSFHPPKITKVYYASQQIYLIALFDKAFGVTQRQYTSQRGVMMVPETDGQTIYDRLLSKIKETCDNVGAELRIVYIPGRFEQKRNLRNPLRDLISDWSTRHAVPYLDIALCPPFDNPSTVSSNYFSVDPHLNVRGHEKVANLLAQFVAE